MLIAFAVIGWVLFILTAILYRVGMRKDVELENALSLLLLNTILSEKALELGKQTVSSAVAQWKDRLEVKEITFQLMQIIDQTAKDTHQINLALVLAEIEKQTLATHI